jgi:hypothetical protein
MRGKCSFCDELLILGEHIGRGPDGWLCLSCTQRRRDIDRIADWLAYYWMASRTPPPLMTLDIDTLSIALGPSFTAPAAPGAAGEPLSVFDGLRLHAVSIEGILAGLDPH